MKITINKSDFIDQFRVMDRLENFSYEGRSMLFDYIEQIEEDTGEELEMDVIAVCCDFSEDAPEDIAANYNIDISECADDDEISETVLEYLNENTSVIGETPSSIIYQSF